MADLNKIRGCMVGGAVGDALGFAVEFLDDELIFKHYGENGITEYALCGDVAQISDDTQMSAFTADGMICAQKQYGNPTPEQYAACVYESYLNWLSTQDGDYVLPPDVRSSDLLEYRELHARRAPGHTCISALQSGKCGTFETKLNNSKGCGGVMRVAPVALFLISRNAPRSFIGETAARVAAITHSHDLGYIPACFFALLLDDFLRVGYTESALVNALKETRALFAQSGELEYFCSLIEKAAAFAADEDISDDLDVIRELGGGWVAEETVAIAVYCALRHRDSFEQAVIAAVNHSGDSDSTGALAGNLAGALLGYDKIPQKYLDKLELREALLTLAEKSAAEPVVEEYRACYENDVKDLLVELQSDLVKLDERGVLVLKDDYRDKYFYYVSEEIEKHDGKIFVAVDCGKAIGAVVCKIFQGGGESELTTSCPRVGFISDLVVTKDQRRRGIGKALIKRAENYFADKGCAYTQLEVFAPNADAFALYRRLGFDVNCLYLSKKLPQRS